MRETMLGVAREGLMEIDQEVVRVEYWGRE